jgi:hypothetical protein
VLSCILDPGNPCRGDESPAKVSKLDRLKEEIAWLKLIFGGLLAIDVSIVAWLAQNYHNAEAVISVGAFIVIMA